MTVAINLYGDEMEVFFLEELEANESRLVAGRDNPQGVAIRATEDRFVRVAGMDAMPAFTGHGDIDDKCAGPVGDVQAIKNENFVISNGMTEVELQPGGVIPIYVHGKIS
jgi:hypothetical protein